MNAYYRSRNQKEKHLTNVFIQYQRNKFDNDEFEATIYKLGGIDTFSLKIQEEALFFQSEISMRRVP